jgi:tetratricopeptide (TPR) repeat protein
MDAQRVMEQARKLQTHLPQLIKLQERATAASQAHTAALGSNDPAQEIATSLALADAEEAVADFLHPLALDPPFHPSHSATIAVNSLSIAAGLLAAANQTQQADDRAEHVLRRALTIASKWCAPDKVLEIECSLADRIAGLGRFAEALSRLDGVIKGAEELSLNDRSASAGPESRQHALPEDSGPVDRNDHSDLDPRAAVPQGSAAEALLARAEILHWLNDPDRAIEALRRCRPAEPPVPDPDTEQASFERAMKAVDQSTASLSGNQTGWSYENGKAYIRLGDVVADPPQQVDQAKSLKQLEHANNLLRQAGSRYHQLTALKRWHQLHFLCSCQLARQDTALIRQTQDAYTEFKRWYQASDQMMASRIPVDIFEPELLLTCGNEQGALAKISELSDGVAANPWLRHKWGVLATWQARALSALGRVTEARSAARTAADALHAAGQVDSEWRAWLLLAQTTEDASERRIALRNGVAAVDAMRLAPLGWRLDNLYLAPRLPLYQDAIRVAADDQDGPAALEHIEKVKSRALTAIIGAGSSIPPKAPPELIAQYKDADAAVKRLQAEVLSGSATAETDKILRQTRTVRARLEEQLRQADPQWHAFTPESIAPARIVEAVSSLDAVAVDLFKVGSRLTAVMVADGTISVSCRDLPSGVLEGLEYLEQALSPPPAAENAERRIDHLAKDPMALGLALDGLLPDSTAARILTSRKVLIAAHGVLHLVPWPVVPVTPKGARLIEIAEVGMLPNLACLPSLVKRPAGTGWCAVIGAPIRNFESLWDRSLPPAALQTAVDVTELHAGHHRLVAPPRLSEAATVKAFEDFCDLPQSARGILHISAHGLPPRVEPGDAALLLADGNLEAASIANRGIDFDEVVLAACSAGFRPATEAQDVVLAGDDALGLPGAFLEAGASVLLVSIPVADAGGAHRMAFGYHAARLAGQAPLAAFRTAQCALLADRSVQRHKACGFVIYGCR